MPSKLRSHLFVIWKASKYAIYTTSVIDDSETKNQFLMNVVGVIIFINIYLFIHPMSLLTVKW